MLRRNPDHVAARAEGKETRLGRTGKNSAAVPGQPPQVAVVRGDIAGLSRHVHPAFGQDAPAIPFPASQQQVTEAGVVAGTGPKTSAPVTASAHRLHAPAADFDIGIAVAVPDPGT